ncbi:MAG: DNA methyltransferase, partial [Bacteroidia bacterium]
MVTKETAYKKIAELVERFEDQYASYKRSEYNETQTRRDFIDPFFKALGWDVDNEQGNAEAYREVIHEDKIKIEKSTKAPDYSFRLAGGKRLFFVEAKKPSVFVRDDMLPAYQVRRYGWNVKLSISIITDFEEFAIYDCTKKPNPTDKAAVARIRYITFREYLTQFDFIWETFSKERVLKGGLDKFIKETGNKRGTATVDKEFLLSLDTWRTYLATSISWNNKSLDEDEINFVVQQTIDRIIFLRIAEGRGIEPYASLQDAIKGGEFYHNLFSIFKEADDKYNSGLFDFKKDQISKSIKVENKVIKSIINDLYYPISPYEFSVLSVEILGSAYEQFLGKTISIDEAHRAKIEEKPEVRKAGGVYYTPQYVVDYIVKNTVGKLTDGKKPEEVSKLKIVDPACGSGSFLIGAYDYLLKYHLDYYTQNKAEAKKAKALTDMGSLTTGLKKEILLNNIYGVDIDVNAVEVTKLSLLLKCMEGETNASIENNQKSMFKQRVLPTLDNNIKSGNSLVDTDFYENQLDFGEEKKIKPFNWKKAFPEVFN